MAKPSSNKKSKKPRFKNYAPLEQLIEEPKPGHIPTKEEIEDRKILQGAILQATQEFMRKHHEEIKARAFEILKEQGH